MGYLGVDVERAQSLASELHRAASSMETVHRQITEAEALCEFTANTTLALDQIRADYERTARGITGAIAVVRRYRLMLPTLVGTSAGPAPARTPVPVGADNSSFGAGAGVLTAVSEPAPAPWIAEPRTVWNDVEQVASHNTYKVDGGIAAMFDLGVRTFELDIHRGPPASLGSSWEFVHRSLGGGNQGTDHAAGMFPERDWRVYHMTGDATSEYEFLRDGLAAVAGLETSDPLTLFIDIKDPFVSASRVATFDGVLEDEFGERLYRPAELLGRAPEAGSLDEAVAVAGWPTIGELSGRILVMLTDNVDEYAPVGTAAFIAPAPHVRSYPSMIDDLGDPNVVVYNANSRNLGIDQIAAIRASGSLLRTYFNPRCALIEYGRDEAQANYRAVDIEPGQDQCRQPVQPPPVDTPVPLFGQD